MNALKLGQVSIIGIVILTLVFGLSANVSAIPYISIGDTTHNFTVVPGQDAEITLPVIIKNVSDDPIKALVVNITYNCSQINITNITQVDIVNVPNAQLTSVYNKLCNGSDHNFGLLYMFCFYMNTTLTTNNNTNASILVAKINNTGNDKCVLGIAFASYKKIENDTIIAKIKAKVKAMPNYFNTSYTSPLNITVEKMGANHTVNVNVSNVNIQSQVKINGLIKACRGDANINNNIDNGDKMLISRAMLSPGNPNYYNLTSIMDCVDLNGNGKIDNGDKMLISRATLSSGNPNYYNLSANILYN